METDPLILLHRIGTGPQPVTTSDASEGCGLPSSLEHYGFELKESSEEDRRIYER